MKVMHCQDASLLWQCTKQPRIGPFNGGRETDNHVTEKPEISFRATIQAGHGQYNDPMLMQMDA